MKHETLMLNGLFAACLLVCTLVLGSMLTDRPPTAQTLATTSNACATTATACPLPRS
ncbi:MULTISPECIES: hypothetical protein [Rhodanobacter]|uniref:Uncharacterized protein n=1 Tax=Rhodanobacter hydrolyticus TaxID=2250595 RepID=A0ABW8J7Q7_9GAMM|nr:hypothetical protein [Rhodanobacter sp. 7MK24]MBD8882167.1 hypothetical protein [Rhodanobacter sp. 7MK24]